jgi:hypothetical protein
LLWLNFRPIISHMPLRNYILDLRVSPSQQLVVSCEDFGNINKFPPELKQKIQTFGTLRPVIRVASESSLPYYKYRNKLPSRKL